MVFVNCRKFSKKMRRLVKNIGVVIPDFLLRRKNLRLDKSYFAE
jgi:hypothetical protein